MAQPTYGAPWRPLADVYGEQWVFEPLTSDPANTENGDHWLRVDLDSGDKLATLRWDHGSGIWDIPVFAVGDSKSNVEEVLRVQTPNGLGFVPVLDSNPAFQQVGFQHAGTRYGLHDLPYAIPDSAVAHWPMDEGSGTTVADNEGSNDLTLSGPTWQSGAGTGSTHLDYDGVNDVSDGTEAPVTGSQNRSVIFWANPDSVGSSFQTFGAWGADNLGERWTMQLQDTGELRLSYGAGSITCSLTPSQGTWQLFGFILDGNTFGDVTFYLDGATDSVADSTTVNTQSTSPIRFGNYIASTQDLPYDGQMDESFITNDALSVSRLDEYRNDTKSRYGL